MAYLARHRNTRRSASPRLAHWRTAEGTHTREPSRAHTRQEKTIQTSKTPTYCAAFSKPGGFRCYWSLANARYRLPIATDAGYDRRGLRRPTRPLRARHQRALPLAHRHGHGSRLARVSSTDALASRSAAVFSRPARPWRTRRRSGRSPADKAGHELGPPETSTSRSSAQSWYAKLG